jgi:hypothetical protein
MLLRTDGLLYWTPRVFALAFAGVLTFLTAGSFAGGGTIFGALTALLIQSAPAALIVLLLLVAWQWELVGAVAFPLLGIAFVVATGATLAAQVYAAITGSLCAIGLLFLCDWMVRKPLRFQS